MTHHSASIAPRRLGERTVCPVGLGCMSLTWAYGRQPSEEAATAILHRALDLGYDHLDTARLYGGGQNEVLVGKALKSLRNRFYLASKAGIFLEGDPLNDGSGRRIDGRPDTLRKACEESLRALQTDHIDLYYLHRLDDDTPIEDTVGGLAELVREGKIGGIGLSEVSAATLRRAASVHPITAAQNEYSLWTRNPEIALLDTCRELGVTLVAFSPLGRGALANDVRDPNDLAENDFRATMPRFTAEHWPKNRALLERFNALATEQGVTPAQLALAWVLSRGEHVIAIPGTGRMDHLEENIARWHWQPQPQVLAQLDELINQDTVSGHRYSDAMRANIDSEEFA